MKTAILITARKGSGKHWVGFRGLPIIEHVLLNTLNVMLPVYVYTDDEKIVDLCGQYRNAFGPLKRPPSPDDEHQGDAIRHAARQLEEFGYSRDDGLLIVWGNVMSVTPQLLWQAERHLKRHRSVLSVVDFHECHPYRALKELPDHRIEPWLEGNEGLNRQGYSPAWFFDGGVMGTRIEHAIDGDGPKPWTWLNRDCYLIKRENPFAFDYHTEKDREALEMLNARMK